MAAELVINGRSGVEGFAQGGIYTECLAISAKDGAAPYPIPNGTKIYVAPALWDNTQQSKWQLGSSPYFEPVWEFTYAAAGIYYGNLINSDNKYKNMRARIRIFTSSLFLVSIEYVALADTHKFLYDYNYQPLNLFTKQSVDRAPLNVYNTANRTIGMRVSIDTNIWVQSNYYVQGIPWQFVNYPSVDNKYFMEVNGKTSNGFVLGEDLKINLRNFPKYTNCQYFAGIFRVDELLNQSMEYYDEIFLQYAKANNTADEPFEFATNTIKRNHLKDFHGFRFDNFESIADFTIDADYFEAGGRYKCFVITKEECQFRSYLLDEFGEAVVRTPIYGDTEIQSINIDGISLNVATGTCLYDVPVCSEMVYVAKMNIASYEAALLAGGLLGAWADYFIGADAYISDGVHQLGVNPFLDSVDYEELLGESIITYSFKIPEDWQGENKIINFVWKFRYGPDDEYITIYTSLQLHTSDDTDIELKSPVLPEEICDVDAISQTICFENPSSTHKFFVDLLKDGVETEDELITNQEANFSTANDACLDFDFEEAETETEYCLKMRAHKQTTKATVRPCIDIVIEFERVAFNGEIYKALRYDLNPWVDADVAEVLLSIVYPTSETLLQSFNKASDEKLFPEDYFATKNPFTLGVFVRRTDGHVYYIELPMVNVNQTITTLTLDICGGTVFQYCDQNPILSHTIVWNYNASGALLSKTITANFLNPGLPSSQTKQYRLNSGAWVAYTVPITVAPSFKVEFRWELVYAACTIELYDCLTEEECSHP